MTAKQVRTAARIDSAMQPLLRAGKDDVAILTGMSNHMTGVMDELCQRYPGFHRYSKVLENIAGAIQSGAIKVPR